MNRSRTTKSSQKRKSLHGVKMHLLQTSKDAAPVTSAEGSGKSPGDRGLVSVDDVPVTGSDADLLVPQATIDGGLAGRSYFKLSQIIPERICSKTLTILNYS